MRKLLPILLLLLSFTFGQWEINSNVKIRGYLNVTDTYTQLDTVEVRVITVGGVPIVSMTQEAVEDFVGAMTTGNTETLITVAYQDGDGTIDFTVDNDLANYDNTSSAFITATLTQEQVEDFAGALVGDGTGSRTGITITYVDATGDIDVVIDHDAASNFSATEHVPEASISHDTIADVSTSDHHVKFANGDETDQVWISDSTDYRLKTTHLAGEVTGAYGSIVLDHDALDDQYYDAQADIDHDNISNVSTSDHHVLFAVGDEADQVWISDSTDYRLKSTHLAGEVTGAYGSTVLDHDALDDQYYDSEADLTGLLDNNYQPLEATLTDIADGTIIEDLVNTNAPWADNEVADNISITNISQVGDISATASEINTPLDGALVTLTEFKELETIGATAISAGQWAGLGGATAAGLALWDDAAALNQLVTLGLSATASEINTPLDGASVTLTEFQELEAIGATTISANQWIALGGLPETVTGTELGYTDGVTSGIQAQIDALVPAPDDDFITLDQIAAIAVDDSLLIWDASANLYKKVDINSLPAGAEIDPNVDSEAEIEAIMGIAFGASKVNTSGYIWVADGTDFESVVMSGDATIASGGAVTVVDDLHDHVYTNIDGLTATTTEINTPLDGASVQLTEFQELETIGATTISANQWAAIGGMAETVTSAEIDYLDGVTSAIQTQLAARMEDLADDATPTAGGTLVMDDNNITGIGSAGFTQELDGGSETGNFSVDFGTDQKHKTTLTANVITLTLDTTFDRVGNYLLKIVNGGLATLTWASESGSIYFPGGDDPTLTASGTDIVTFYYDGTDWYGMSALDFQ